MPDDSGLSLEEIRTAFPEWNVVLHHRLGVWLAVRPGLQQYGGPESLIQRVVAAKTLADLAERLEFQRYLEGLDPKQLESIYRDWLVAMS